MKNRKWVIWIMVLMLVVGVTAVFVYGKSSVESKAEKSYFESLNEYDWGKTCPGASCRDKNED